MNLPYTPKELDQFKLKLLSQKNNTIEQIQYWSDQISTSSDRGRNETNVLHNAQSHSDIEYANFQLSRQKKHLNDVEAALIRIENNTYGRCKITGKYIDKVRLLAVPTTTKSI